MLGFHRDELVRQHQKYLSPLLRILPSLVASNKRSIPVSLYAVSGDTIDDW